MDHKQCFGSLKEVNLSGGQTMTQSRPECRNCEEIRDCLRYTKQLADEKKEKEELRKQNFITQIIDHSYVFSNDLGSCILKFLSRIYSSPLGTVLFKNLFLFFEIPRNSLSSNFPVAISRTMIDLLRGGKDELESPAPHLRRGLEDDFALRIILFHRSFPDSPEANIGMIAYEAARALASDDLAIKQILQVLSDSEADKLRKIDSEARTRWLIEKWGFMDEFEALKKEMAVKK
ncbi:MAG TPA: hypothetical protein VK568_00085 [Thermodesulfobacteriota bacterium]|jgi:hypothetical protein|nr:hypothetical protein [Thermodesulfobacteriota bacterium]